MSSVSIPCCSSDAVSPVGSTGPDGVGVRSCPPRRRSRPRGSKGVSTRACGRPGLSAASAAPSVRPRLVVSSGVAPPIAAPRRRVIVRTMRRRVGSPRPAWRHSPQKACTALSTTQGKPTRVRRTAYRIRPGTPGRAKHSVASCALLACHSHTHTVQPASPCSAPTCSASAPVTTSGCAGPGGAATISASSASASSESERLSASRCSVLTSAEGGTAPVTLPSCAR